MKKYKNIIAVVIVAAILIFGIIKAIDFHNLIVLKDQVNDYEARAYSIATEAETDLDEMDMVGLNHQREELNVLLEDIKVTAEEYDKESLEYKMLNELAIVIEYLIESVDIMVAVIDDPWSMLTGVPEQQLMAIEKEMEKHMNLYDQYKAELKILDDIAEIESQDI